jgi:nicotinamide-nucleotide amidase
MFDDEVLAAARTALAAARRREVLLATAESCTGGLVAAALTAIAGSSDAVDGGVVTYSNAAKVRLGVPEATLAAHGAVSEATARALAAAVLAAGPAPRAAVAVTGIAGPGGGTAEKPVGLVHFAAATADVTLHREMRFGDLGRDGIRRASVVAALALLVEALDDGR